MEDLENDEHILEAEIGDNVEISEETKKQLSTKGEKATCKIFTIDEKGNPTTGSGFFCKIPYLNKTIKVLFTNKHILNRESIKLGNKIKLAYKEEIKLIEITNERLCKINDLYDMTCIEILYKDDIEDFFEIEDCNIFNNYNNEDIAIIQYPKGGYMKVKAGHLIKINDYNIFHSVDTDNGSSGSPIILLSRKFKIIGIHRSYNKIKKLNIGSYIKNIIEYINKNEIICKYDITKDNIGKEIQILNCQDNLNNKTFFNFISKIMKTDLEKYSELYINKKTINYKRRKSNM